MRFCFQFQPVPSFVFTRNSSVHAEGMELIAKLLPRFELLQIGLNLTHGNLVKVTYS